jgi:hypothetical protein
MENRPIDVELIYVNYSAAKTHPETAIFVDTTGT